MFLRPFDISDLIDLDKQIWKSVVSSGKHFVWGAKPYQDALQSQYLLVEWDVTNSKEEKIQPFLFHYFTKRKNQATLKILIFKAIVVILTKIKKTPKYLEF